LADDGGAVWGRLIVRADWSDGDRLVEPRTGVPELGIPEKCRWSRNWCRRLRARTCASCISTVWFAGNQPRSLSRILSP